MKTLLQIAAIAMLLCGLSHGQTLEQISPTSTAPGSADFTLSLTGIGFASGCAVRFDDVGYKTSYHSSIRLDARIPSDRLNDPAEHQISASCPNGDSNTLPFIVGFTSLGPPPPPPEPKPVIVCRQDGITIPCNITVDAGIAQPPPPPPSPPPSGPATIVITVPNVGTVTVGSSVSFAATIANTGGTVAAVSQVNPGGNDASQVFKRIAGGNCGPLDTAFSLNPGASCTAMISYAPTAPGSQGGYLCVVSDASNPSQCVAISAIAIAATAALTIVDEPLPDATCGQPYSYQFKVTGGTPPYKWSLAAGSLPPGFSLSETGLLSGTVACSTTSADDAGGPGQAPARAPLSGQAIANP